MKSIVLGCVQPGEPVGQFADALKRLSGQATHLYVDGAQYWYSLQPNVTRVAADRAASNFIDRDADDEVKRRISEQSDRGSFTAIQVFAEGPGDVPDDDEGVRLVVLSPTATHSPNDEHSPAVDLAERILAQRDGGPRLNRNLLVFTAAAANRLSELRTATRLYLAWCSVVDDHQALDLTAHQKKQAESKVKETSQQVDSLIAETFTQVLTPAQEPGTSAIKWQTTKVTTVGDVGARVSKKLATEEKLIATYGGVRVKMDIDRYDLWSERGDIPVSSLWSSYARYPHMPRLASFSALADAISDGTSNLNWSQETFAYAEAHDGSTWVGVSTASHVSPTVSGLLVHPNSVPARTESEEPAWGAGSNEPGNEGRTGSEGAGPSNGGGQRSSGSAATQFYAQFDLDSVRGIKQLGEILEHVTARLGPNVELSLEVRAANADGYDDATQRIVTENATNLGANGPEFE